MRRVWITGLLACLLAGVFAAVAAAMPATRGVLTKAEYQQLLTTEKHIKALSPNDPQGLNKAEGICRRLRRVSPLIAAVRTDCLDLVAFGRAGSGADTAATHCALDPPSEQAVLRCLLPHFRVYYRDAKTFYAADKRVAKLAAARGFSGRCAAVIGDSKRALAAEQRLVGDLKTMVGALQAGNVNTLEAAGNRVTRDSHQIGAGPSSLSLCPHQ